MVRQAVLWILALVILAGVGIRAYNFTDRSLWFDEAFSWRLVEFPFSEMIQRAAADVHPPLYYIILRGWAEVFGFSILSLRSFSVAMAGATIVAAYGFIAYATRSRVTGLFAATVVALSGWQIAFAWEARMYTLGTFLAIVSTWVLLHATRKQLVYAWIGYGLLAGAFAYTHYFAFFTLAAHALFVAGTLLVRTRGRIGEIINGRMFWFALLSVGIAVGLYAPWIPTFLKQNAQVQASYWVPPIGGWSIPDTFYRMVLPTPGIPPHTWPELVLTVLPIIGAFVIWIILFLLPRNRDGNTLVALSGLIPFLMAIGISFVGQSLYQDRFLVFAGLFVWLGAAVIVGHMPKKMRQVSMAVLVIFSLFATYRYFAELDISSKPGAAGATAYVNGRIASEQLLVVTSPFIFFSVDHYMQESYGKKDRARLYSETGEFSHFAGGPILEQEDFIGPEVFAGAVDTLWIVDTNGFGGSKLEVPSSWVAVDEAEFPELYGYQGQVFVTQYQRVDS